jgi:hypothetical protein
VRALSCVDREPDCFGGWDGMSRKRPLLHLTLSPEAIARLDELAVRSGESKSGVVERLVREAELPRKKAGSEAT